MTLDTIALWRENPNAVPADVTIQLLDAAENWLLLEKALSKLPENTVLAIVTRPQWIVPVAAEVSIIRAFAENGEAHKFGTTPGEAIRALVDSQMLREAL